MRKLIYLLTTILFLTTKNSTAQFVEAQQCIGGNGNDVIVDVQKTADSGLIVLVLTSSNDGDFEDNSKINANALIKLNSHYEIEWKKSYGDTNVIFIPRLIQHEQDYYLSFFSYGYPDSTLNYQNYYNLTRIDANGNKLWNKSYVITGLTNMYAFSGQLMLSDIKFLKNNTIAFSTIVDTSFLLHNIDKNGNTVWDLRYNYDTLFRDGSSWSWWGYPFFTFNNFIAELNDNTILLTNAMSDFCMWFCSNTVSKTHLINIDYNGELIKERYSDTLLSIYYYKTINEDADNIYYLDANGYNTKINKNDLSFEMTYLQNGQMLNIYDYVFNNNSAIQNDIPLYFNTEYDSMGNSSYFLQKYDLVNNTILYKTLLDTMGNGRYMNYNAAYYLPNNGYIIIYAKDNIYKIVKLDNFGNIIYNKLLSPSIRTNEINSGYFGFMNNYYLYPLMRAYNISYDNKLYSYNTWSSYDTAFNTIYTQNFFIHDIETGELEYEYTNDMKDTLLYKYIAPYPDKKNELFVLADLNGQNTCKLGGYDIKMFQVISATNKILGKAFIDYNSNNIQESGEPPYRLAYLESSKNNYSLSTYMYGNNYTTNYADTGTWITKLIPHHTYYDINPVSFISSHSTFGNNDTVVFAMHPTRTVNDLKVSLINSFITRLGNTTTYEIAYANEGTHTANGTIKLVLDNRLNFSTSNPNLTSQNGDTLIWDFSNLLVNETRKIIVQSNVPIPPTLNVGDSLHSIVFIEPNINDSTPNDNHAALDEVILGSYDPNDKTSTSGSTITPAQIQRGDYITYVVRFQNTGNDTAFRIVIEDTLDANLDWNTLQPVNTSHPFSMQVINKNVIQFTFSNMKLPPASINEAASHGFIAYKVKPKSDLAQGNTIKNTAHIYFDFNQPVTTNTVNTNVVLLSAIKNNIKNNGKISVYPNPNNGIFNLEFTANYSSLLSVSIIDITGKIVYQNQIQHHQKSTVTINTDNLPGGMYSVVLKTDKEQLTEKIIIDK